MYRELFLAGICAFAAMGSKECVAQGHTVPAHLEEKARLVACCDAPVCEPLRLDYLLFVS